MEMLKSFIGAICLCTATVSAAQAQAEREPNSVAQLVFMVVKVERHDVLNIRSGPSAEFGVIGELPPGSRGIAIIGDCQSAWCPVQHLLTSGWVNRKYLANEPRLSAIQPSPSPGSPLASDASRPSRHEAGVEATKNAPEVAFVFFVSQGWADHQAAGIVGNLQAECGHALNCSTGSGGLAQWQGERVTRFRHVFGYPFAKATFKDQLSYIQWELTHPKSAWKDTGRILKGAKDAASAASLFDVHYEKSSGATRAARIANARAILKKYGGRSAS
jgi:Phage tail lysozyme/Bacterial SH3 domain